MSKKLELDPDLVTEVVGTYADQRGGLDSENRQLAEKIVMLTEYADGRNLAARAMGVGPTTLDNYRMGRTQPKFYELLKLVEVAGHPVDYLLAGTTYWKLAHSECNGAAGRGPEIDETLMASVGKLVVQPHRDAGIKLPTEALLRLCTDSYNDLRNRADDVYDVAELETLLPWLERKLKKDILAALTAPGTGKRPT